MEKNASTSPPGPNTVAGEFLAIEKALSSLVAKIERARRMFSDQVLGLVEYKLLLLGASGSTLVAETLPRVRRLRRSLLTALSARPLYPEEHSEWVTELSAVCSVVHDYNVGLRVDLEKQQQSADDKSAVKRLRKAIHSATGLQEKLALLQQQQAAATASPNPDPNSKTVTEKKPAPKKMPALPNWPGRNSEWWDGEFNKLRSSGATPHEEPTKGAAPNSNILSPQEHSGVVTFPVILAGSSVTPRGKQALSSLGMGVEVLFHTYITIKNCRLLGVHNSLLPNNFSHAGAVLLQVMDELRKKDRLYNGYKIVSGVPGKVRGSHTYYMLVPLTAAPHMRIAQWDFMDNKHRRATVAASATSKPVRTGTNTNGVQQQPQRRSLHTPPR